MLYLVLHGPLAEVQSTVSQLTLIVSAYLVLHGPLAEVDGVVRVVRGPAVGGPVVPGLEPQVRNQVKVMSDLHVYICRFAVLIVQVSVKEKAESI